MAAVVLNILIGLVTSVLSGSAVWLWQRLDKTRILRRKAAFFGLTPGGRCLVVMNHRWHDPTSTHQNDVHALIGIGALASEAGARVSVKSCDDICESNADRTEFCVGGPGSNPRTAGHLAACLPGLTVSASLRDKLTIIAAGQRFAYDRGKLAYAVVAKFTPAGSAAPVILICGQSAISNRAAVHLLERDWRRLARTIASGDRFCLIVRATAPAIYGHEMVDVAMDASDTAFQPRSRVPAPE